MKVLPQAILSYLSNLDARCVPDIGGTQACWCRGGHVLGSAIRSCVLSLLPSDSRAFHTAYAQSGRARPTASMKERVGAALSLDKFARAKVSKYDKRKVIEKQRTLKAKQISKYKKLKQRLGSAGAPLDYTPYDPAQDGTPEQKMHNEQNQDRQEQRQQQGRQQERHSNKRQQHVEQPAADAGQQIQQQHEAAADSEQQKLHKKHQKLHKPPSQLQRLAGKAADDRAAKEQEQQQREQALAERQRQAQQKQKQRSHQKHDFFKKTKRGQPLMKYRLGKVLAVLEKEQGHKS